MRYSILVFCVANKVTSTFTFAETDQALGVIIC